MIKYIVKIEKGNNVIIFYTDKANTSTIPSYGCIYPKTYGFNRNCWEFNEASLSYYQSCKNPTLAHQSDVNKAIQAFIEAVEVECVQAFRFTQKDKEEMWK